MKSLERRFNRTEAEHPEWSTLTIFNMAAWKQGFSFQRLQKYFYKLIDRDDYAYEDRYEVLGYALTLTKRH